MVVPNVPEIVENEPYESLNARLEHLGQIRELGPPDLVHLKKHNPKSQVKEIGTYHHVTGVDASSSASLAAYVNDLTYLIGDGQVWFGKVQHWKIVQGVYCCYNAFSRVDLRVTVSFPGGVEAYTLDERGERGEATEQLWLETYLSAILRAYAYADDITNDVVGTRRFNPIASTDAEHRFFDAAEKLFFKGHQLGSDTETQVPNLVANHLADGILNYIHTTGRFASGVNLFEKLRSKDPEIASLLARVMIDGDDEVKAVRVTCDAIRLLPMDFATLDVQAKFLISKKDWELALPIAQRGICAAPSEFKAWARLAETFLAMEKYEDALLTINSCPMLTHQDTDKPKMPQPAKMHLPILPEYVLDEILDDEDARHEMVDPILLKLPGATLKGTFLRAYLLLTTISNKCGWDMLLKFRSNNFIMEEEYRNEKTILTMAQKEAALRKSAADELKAAAQNGNRDSGASTLATGGDTSKAESVLSVEKVTVSPNNEPEENVEPINKARASIESQKGVIVDPNDMEEVSLDSPVKQLPSESFPVPEQTEDANEEEECDEKKEVQKEEGESLNVGGLEEVSLHDNHSRTSLDKERVAHMEEVEEKFAEVKLDSGPIGAGVKQEKEEKEEERAMDPESIQKPVEMAQTAGPQVQAESASEDEASDTNEYDEDDAYKIDSEQTFTGLKNKRLCERWLDNLFMILYEDLRIYSVWRSEILRTRQRQQPYTKSATEWEILGDLAMRLHQEEDAIDAYNSCLAIRFSPSAQKALLTYQMKKRDYKSALISIQKLATWQYRWYSQFSPYLLYCVREILAEEGALKMRSLLLATGWPPKVLELSMHYSALCAAFRTEGSDNRYTAVQNPLKQDQSPMASVRKDSAIEG